MLIKLLSLSLTKSETRIRIPASLETDILEFAGVEKFASALPVLEQIIQLEESITTEVENGSRFFETEKGGEQYIVKWVYANAASSGDGQSRVRITQELHDYILKRSGANQFSEAIPYIQSCVNMAKLIFEEVRKGSSYIIEDSNGVQRKVGFI